MLGNAVAGTPPNDRVRKPGPRYQPLVLVALAVCAGMVADRYGSPALAPVLARALALAPALAWWWCGGAVLLLAWLVLRRRGCDRAAGVAIFAASLCLGGAWHHARWNLFAQDDLALAAHPIEQPVCFEAEMLSGVRTTPAPRPDPMRLIPMGPRAKLEVWITGVRDGPTWREASGRARLWVNGELLGVHAGDRLRVFAQFSRPQPARNPGEFDFAAYARGDRIGTLASVEHPACVEVRQPAGVFSLRRNLERLRAAGQRLLHQYIAPEHAGLATAILLGTREEVAAEQNDAFMRTGTIHVLSISGLHVGILAGALFAALRLVVTPRRLTALIVAGVVTVYVVMTDAEPPAVRSLILVLVICGAYAMGRRPLGMNTLAAAALTVVAMSPADLFHVGTQLSFLCVWALSWAATRDPPDVDGLEQLIAESRPWPIRIAMRFGRDVWRLTLVGAMVWALTIPLVMARFHLFSVVALVLNTLLWLPTTAVLWTGLGALAMGAVYPPAAAPLAWCCDGLLACTKTLIDIAARLPGAYHWVSGPDDWWLAGFYGAVALAAAFPRWRPPRRWCAAIVAGWIAVGLLPTLGNARSESLRCTFLSVDHGLATILRLPSGKVLLYDAGKFSSPDSGVRIIAGALWAKGIRHLDGIVLSHADADHYNAVPGLLERFSVGAVYVSPVMFHEESKALDALRRAIESSGTPLREISAGAQIPASEGCRIEVLHPPRRGLLLNDNANSIVLGVEYAGRRILLPGDLAAPGLASLLAEEPWRCDVLLAPHHGSRASDPPGLADWAGPRWLVASGGFRYDIRQTLLAYQQRNAQVLHTGQRGAIEFQLDASEVNVATFLPNDASPPNLPAATDDDTSP